ncbi:HISTIDINE-TRNA LIGASE [Salix viminalis]|uniref:HISTIDINE-TRNA LIGASE n=1 Tax=Salix viminalis TaxID=40686 RepID=A0A9Q0NN40_SALVM|nr:HISTIDINE-TRNA LIGASE [Salix viminalis]
MVMERQDSAEDEQNMTAVAPVVDSSSVSIEINGNTKEVQDKIESCLQLYMNKEDVVKTLFQLDGIDPSVTTLAWNQLEEERPEIFKDFYSKLILEEPSCTSNQLLEQQDDLENLLAYLDDPFASIEQDFQHIPVDTLPWGDTIPLEVPIPSGDLYIDSLSTVSCRQLVNDENPASDSFHPAQMNFERLMAMERNAADIAPVPLFINLEIPNPASVARNDHTEAEHDPILSCLNSPEPPGPVFGILTDTSGSAILPDLPGSNFNPGNSMLPDTPETNSLRDFGTLLDPPEIDVDELQRFFLGSQSEEES